MPEQSELRFPQTHCEICGGRLDLKLLPSDGSQNSVDTTCTVCGRTSGYSWTTFGTGSRAGTSRIPKFPFPRPRRPRRPRYMNDDGSVDFKMLVEETGFPVYGLTGRPAGLRFKSVGQSSSSGVVRSVTLKYRLGHPRNPDAALDFDEANEDPYRNARPELMEGARTEREFQAVRDTVMNSSAPEQTKRWYYDGDFNSVWNIERASAASREAAELEIAGENRLVEMSSWEEPFKVAVYTFAIPPIYFTACSLNLARQDSMDALRQLSVMQGNDEAIAAHQADIMETRKLLWPNR